MSHARGMSLLEVLAALVLMAGAAVALLSLTGQSLSASAGAEARAIDRQAADTLLRREDVIGGWMPGRQDAGVTLTGRPWTLTTYALPQDDEGAELPTGLILVDIQVGDIRVRTIRYGEQER